MKTIRLGNDIVVRWSILRNGIADDLSAIGKPITVIVSGLGEEKRIENYAIEGNVISFKLYGRDLQTPGIYRLTYIENEGLPEMYSVDCNRAFRISGAGQATGGEDTVNITTETIELSSEVTAPADGLSAYELAVINGYVGTVEEWLQSLKSEKAQSTTYSNLVSLRDSNRLIPGMQYRITDYDFTTTEADTDSAHMPFDIIVTADSESVINESARAIHHQYAEGEEDPLSSRDIAAWEIRYTLKNIKHSSTDGKGTILWMKDESRNECYYDFINALFKVYEITACSGSQYLIGTYAIKISNSKITFGTNSKLVSTFGKNNHDNIIKYNGLAKMVFGNDCHSNTFGTYCKSNTFGHDCYSNTFGADCNFNIFSAYFYHNTFGNRCSSNIFGDSCSSNTFGNFCDSNIFDDNCKFNTLGSSCSNIKVLIDGKGGFSYNRFGDECRYIEVRNASSLGSYVQNYNFSGGLKGKSSSYLVIECKTDRNYETRVSIDSNGVLKTYCLADLVASENDGSYPYSASFIGEL